NTLRWAADIRPWDDIKLPPEGKKGSNLKEAELKMARQLIGDMTETWTPEAYADRFTEAIHALVAKRVQSGDTEKVEAMEEGAQAGPSNVVDLTELLARSLKRKPAAEAAPARKAPARKAAARKR